jgi:uncharacterized membrane protein (DUF106 family)
MDPATSLLVVTGAAVIASIGQTFISVKTVDPRKLQTLQAELRDYFSDLEAAKKSSDKKLLKQIEKKKKYMDSLQSEVSNSTLKMSLFTMVFALAIFVGLYYLYKPGESVAFLSTYLWDETAGAIKLDYLWWYVVANLFFSTVVRKIMGVT